MGKKDSDKKQAKLQQSEVFTIWTEEDSGSRAVWESRDRTQLQFQLAQS